MRTSTTRWVAPLVALALLAAACSTAGGESETTTTTAAVPEDGTTATTSATGGSSTEGFDFKIAIFEDLTTANYWAYLDPENSVWNAYVFANQAPALFQYAQPTLQLVPLLADGLPAEPVQEGEVWTVTQPLREGLVWSDGEPITAADIVFTYETVARLGLGGQWLSSYPTASEDDPSTEGDESANGLLSVEAVDDHTVKYTFNTTPGLALWQFGVGLAAVLPQHHWADAAAAATTPEELYAVDGIGAPGMWAYDFTEREPGAFARNEANENYPFQDSVTTIYANGAYRFVDESAGIDETHYGEPGGDAEYEYTEGPYAGNVTYSIYSSQDAAVLALTEGEVDYMLNSLGLQRGLQQLVLSEPELEVVVNPANSYRYLAFNTRKWPMSDVAFRKAIACMIDKDFMANSVLQGSALPAWSQVPEANAFWFNADVPRFCEGLTQEERLAQAVQLLKDAGYTWETEPTWDPDNLDALPKGEGLRGPNGEEVPQLTLLAPGPGYDPLRATYSLFVEDWAQDLGIPVTAEPTGFNVIVDQITDKSAPFDMYILGWSLTPFPDHIVDFFASKNDSTLGGNNYPGYNNPAFDALASEFEATTDVEQARELVKEMDALLAEDMPYVVLFSTPIIEPYRNSIEFPFTDTLSGLQNVFGVPSFVKTAA